MLDLQPGVHLQVVELAVGVEELDGARVDVPAAAGHRHRGFAHCRQHGRIDGRRGRLLHELLVAALGGTVPGPQMHAVPVGVGKDLHLDVAGPVEVALHVQLVAPEVGESLPLGRLHRGGCLRGRGHDLHAPAAPAVGGLDGHRPAVGRAEGLDLGRVDDRLGGARDRVHPGLDGRAPRRDLVPHDLDGRGRRADEDDTEGGHGPGEVGVLAEESVAGMHGVGAAALHRGDEGVGSQVALGRGRATQCVGLIGEPHVHRVAVLIGVDGRDGDAHFPAGPDHPDRDLTPVGYENLREHEVIG